MAYELPCPMPMSMSCVRKKAESLFWDYVQVVGVDYIIRNGIDFNEAYDAIIYPRYEIILDCNTYLDGDNDDDEILGQYLPKDNVAIINKTLIDSNDPRRVFTTVHEVVGHGILHGDYLRKTGRDFPALFSTEKSMRLMDNTFEAQANTMAAHFISPLGLVLALFKKVFGTWDKIRYTGPGKYRLNVNGMSRSVWAQSPYQLAWQVAIRLKQYFGGLSTESLMYRVLEVAIDSNGYGNRDFGSQGKVDSIAEIISGI